MLTLDCLLIDTIQSFREGRIKGSEGSTAQAFLKFFRQSPALSVEFSSRRVIDDFFDAIRCGLMHDGETRKGWRVRRRHQTKVIETVPGGFVLYRDNFHKAVEAEFQTYLENLGDQKSVTLRENFLLRMDAICGETPAPTNKIDYFAYGSNMDKAQMSARTPSAELRGVGSLDGYQLLFNKQGADGSAKANIQVCKGTTAVVLGALYRLSATDFEILKRFEVGYMLETVDVVLADGASVKANTFVADGKAVVQGSPSELYIEGIINGAHELGLRDQYVEMLNRAKPHR